MTHLHRSARGAGRVAAAALVLAAWLALGVGGAAAQEKPAGGGHAHPAGAPADGAVLPQDLPGTWAAIRAEQAAIAQSSAQGALGDVHPRAERLAQLAQGLGARSGELAADKRARVEGAAKQLAKLADTLHVAADGGDAAAVKRDLERVGSLLRLIEAQYPAGALGPAQSGAAPAAGPLPDVAAGGAADASAHGGKAGHDHAAPAHGGKAGHEHAAHAHGAKGGTTAAAGHDHAAHAHGAGHGAHGTAHAHGRPTGVVDASPRAELAVSAAGMRFAPQVLRVTAGVPTRISLRNADGLDHALVIKTPGGDQDWVHLHALAGAQDAATYQLDAPGRYPIACTIPGHTEAGMVAELIVENPAQAD